MKHTTFVTCLLLLTGIGSKATNKHKITEARDTVQKITLDTLKVTAHAGLPPYQPTNPLTWEILNTRVALSFNMEDKTADVKEWINLHPYFYATDSIVLDAKTVKLDSVCLSAKNGTHSTLNYTYNDNKLTIHFKNLYERTQEIQLFLKYKAMPYSGESGGSAAITDDRGLYFINTDYKTAHKPAEIWTQGETEANSHWMITVDKPNVRFTTQIELTVPDSFTTLSNGALQLSKKTANGMRTDIWRMDVPIQAYAVMFAAGKYSVIKKKWKNKEVNYYVEPEFAPYAHLMFNHTPEMIAYFSEVTGVPYPWNKYSQIVARDYVSGAMENTSASLFGEFMNQNAREIADKNSEDVVSHELFHQWFGDYVTCESWSNITVNESFANYGEQLWREHQFGKAYRDELAWEDLQKYLGASYTHDPQLVRFNYDNREAVFDAISYNKGGAILHYLNTLIGDEAFQRAMKLYLTKNALHSAEAHNWRMAVEEATGLDWNWFFNEWYYHAGHPVLKVAYKYDDSASRLFVTVMQVQEDTTFMYKLPLKTKVIYGNEVTIVDWDVNKRRDSFVFEYKNGIRPVIIPDYLHILPGAIKENKKTAEWLVEYTKSTDYVSRLLAVKEAFKALPDSAAQVIITLALNDSLKPIATYALTQLSDLQSEKYRRAWTPAVLQMARTEKERHARAAAIDVAGTWKLSELKPDLVRAVYDSSYLVAGNALNAINQIDPDTAYILAKSLLGTDIRATLKGTVWTIIGKKGMDNDISLFEKDAPYELGNKKFTFSNILVSYLKKVKSDESFNRGVAVYQQLVASEYMKNYKAFLVSRLFDLGTDEKSDITTAVTAEDIATAKSRTEAVKTALRKLISEEEDASVAENMRKNFKNNFETE